jgi:predicted amidophosphoribosyltransferase
MEKEVQTVWLMINLYCRGQHGIKDCLCSECNALLDYVRQRLEKCPLKENKPKCSKCTIHCYKPDMRERIRAVMRYSGPRMLYRHPILSGRHYLTGK